ncbi:3-hydroxybutyryl-CoA dehydrogenase [Ruminiclostridium sufflavum DSM 19573]|uniref:3-hydroxybutyryl-CoA dehydrogenase n=1 Tax=Ruminiclostridium sufflavum DSM 19573 TaxID=1121337 RepID=A0A318XHV9_9FIRM|nr:3-hydroxyacyl-CoA dehydrogenase family protein [Ruminiclostridium sufflavum]PYG84943.1 3-hydroxybutyryl-CoA dehydrogenase [Ruminiclostridium sufflavum DSM 19573]
MQIEKIGVVGAGNIGSSLAHSLMLYNKKIILVDVSKEVLEKSKKNIKQSLRFAHMYLKRKEKFDANLIDNITFTTDMNALSDCDFVVENVTENWKIKEEVYRQLDQICRRDVCFGVNTSCISITKVGAITTRPDRVIGMHFMNPVYLKPCVEVIKGYHTSESTIEEIEAFLERVGKYAVIVNDFPGFVSNRISHLFMNEAVLTIQDGVAKPEEVDSIFKNCFNHKMGPLETADLIGLDTVYNSLIVLYESYHDSKYRPAPLLAKMVDAGLLGVKTGKGFYTYND